MRGKGAQGNGRRDYESWDKAVENVEESTVGITWLAHLGLLQLVWVNNHG